jgi:hypothetical protein
MGVSRLELDLIGYSSLYGFFWCSLFCSVKRDIEVGSGQKPKESGEILAYANLSQPC